MMALGLKLFLAHVLGDFVFQPDGWVADKQKKKQRSAYLYLHLLVHSLALLILLQFDFAYWKAMLLIIASHFVIDLCKLYLQSDSNQKFLFITDQVLHVAVILWAVSFYEGFSLSPGWFYREEVLLFLLALLCITIVSAIIIRSLVAGWRLEETNEESLKNAGKYIGMLERLFVFGFIVLNQWASIGLLIAAKSIFRFSDLSRAKDRKLTEYILIGTLLSFGLAIVISLLYQYALVEIKR
jgi:uncharacterized membrane protein